MQGARLNYLELRTPGVDAHADRRFGGRDHDEGTGHRLVIVGADRIARNGDTANKIGTYGLAIIAAHHGIPFYVAAPRSTFDFAMDCGTEIPIEERGADEVTSSQVAARRRRAPTIRPST